MVFLWCFLPAVLFIYYVIDKRFKNAFLLFASLLFYFWGEPSYILVLLSSIVFNYFMARGMDKAEGGKRRLWLVLAIAGNLLLLGYFKYFNFLIETLNMIAGKEQFVFKHVALPIGISFYTFQSLSYIIDLYKKKIELQKNFINLALYIALFPQLIAGPIVKYAEIEKQLSEREEKAEKFAEGVRRFITGLGKKVIIANTLATAADKAFSCSPSEISTPLAWCGVVCYMFQIYFDFSGYSDMAIGLGKMFGFDFLENFNIPYISRSIREYWRRWHISLSTWFKEYVYIPLGGNRAGNTRTYVNLWTVFLLTGLWHGAGFTFVIWGAYHGFFIVLERIFLGKFLESEKFKFLSHVYFTFTLLMGWVLFRANDIMQAVAYYKAMFIGNSTVLWSLREAADIHTLIALILGILCCGYFAGVKDRITAKIKAAIGENAYSISCSIGLIFIFAWCILKLVSGTYNPFIYFRF